MDSLFIIFGIIFIIGIALFSYVAVALLAKHYKRNIPIWLLLSIFMSPILVALILCIIGENENIKEIE